MSEQEKVAGGPLGKAVGRAKQMVGAALDRDDLHREGKLQEVQADAQTEASAKEAEAERREREAEIEAERVEEEHP